MQQRDAGNQSLVAIEQPGAQALRRYARDCLTAIEAGGHAIILSRKTPRAMPDARDVDLATELDTMKTRVTLIEHGLLQLLAVTCDAAGNGRATGVAGELARDESVVSHGEHTRVEAEAARLALEPDLDSFRDFLSQVWIPDLESPRCLVRALRKQLLRFRRALRVRGGRPGGDAERQIVARADTSTCEIEGALARDERAVRRLDVGVKGALHLALL